ncbi:hypothetical protein SAY86_002241 [Trapa natans]|uniref:Myb-like domain-containing protein n=1 Tax=Trapa natans TaxID=22666 RepID=A0AAN7R062_TRANT|nr:hypothetical protein SAY86_002241 [Trapa natans]
MYLSSEKPRPPDFYKVEDPSSIHRDMIIEDIQLPSSASNGDIPSSQQHMVLGDRDGDHDGKSSAAGAAPSAIPKKRAETWVQDETRYLISFRRDMDSHFNTSKSNKHLWDQISSKMREKGFDRSPTMCTDKWRNLLKEFKKTKYQDRGGSGSAKMTYYKEIDDILRGRSKNAQYKSPLPSSKVDSFMQFSDKGMDETGISFGPVEASGRSTLNLERRLEHDEHPLAITPTDAVAANGVPPWNWRETPGNGGDSQSYGGRVIAVKWGDFTRRIGIDGSAESIKEAIKCAFGLRTKRAFWLEDEDHIIRSLDRDMPLGNYDLHLDEGLAIKVCIYDESDQIPVHTEDKIFYTEDDYGNFLDRRGWMGLREFDGYRTIDSMDDLRPGALYRAIYRGVN